KQALLRARPVGASEAVSARLREEMDRHRYPACGLDDSRRREITRMKARAESARLPRGADPSRPLRRGRGGMPDGDWSVQIAILGRAHAHPARRTTSTMDALRAAGEAELVPQRSACERREAWTLAWQIRRSLFLWKGREGEVLP